MNRRICGIALTVAAVLAAAGCTHCPAPSEARAKDEEPKQPPGALETPLVDLIDPMIGVTVGRLDDINIHGLGKTFPGAAYPWGIVQLSPDTVTGGDVASGYDYSHGTIEGFSRDPRRRHRRFPFRMTHCQTLKCITVKSANFTLR